MNIFQRNIRNQGFQFQYDQNRQILQNFELRSSACHICEESAFSQSTVHLSTEFLCRMNATWDFFSVKAHVLATVYGVVSDFA